MGACHFVVGGVLPSGEYVPDCINGNPNVLIRVMGSPAFTVIASCYLLIITYALTLAPVCWIYAAEVWSLETRATGMSIAALCNWLFNFALGMYIPPGFRSIRWGLFSKSLMQRSQTSLTRISRVRGHVHPGRGSVLVHIP